MSGAPLSSNGLEEVQQWTGGRKGWKKTILSADILYE